MALTASAWRAPHGLPASTLVAVFYNAFDRLANIARQQTNNTSRDLVRGLVLTPQQQEQLHTPRVAGGHGTFVNTWKGYLAIRQAVHDKLAKHKTGGLFAASAVWSAEDHNVQLLSKWFQGPNPSPAQLNTAPPQQLEELPACINMLSMVYKHDDGIITGRLHSWNEFKQFKSLLEAQTNSSFPASKSTFPTAQTCQRIFCCCRNGKVPWQQQYRQPVARGLEERTSIKGCSCKARITAEISQGHAKQLGWQPKTTERQEGQRQQENVPPPVQTVQQHLQAGAPALSTCVHVTLQLTHAGHQPSLGVANGILPLDAAVTALINQLAGKEHDRKFAGFKTDVYSFADERVQEVGLPHLAQSRADRRFYPSDKLLRSRRDRALQAIRLAKEDPKAVAVVANELQAAQPDMKQSNDPGQPGQGASEDWVAQENKPMLLVHQPALQHNLLCKDGVSVAPAPAPATQIATPEQLASKHILQLLQEQTQLLMDVAYNPDLTEDQATEILRVLHKVLPTWVLAAGEAAQEQADKAAMKRHMGCSGTADEMPKKKARGHSP